MSISILSIAIFVCIYSYTVASGSPTLVPKSIPIRHPFHCSLAVHLPCLSRSCGHITSNTGSGILHFILFILYPHLYIELITPFVSMACFSGEHRHENWERNAMWKE